MDGDFLRDVAIFTIIFLLCFVVGRAILAHRISRRWNADWDGLLSNLPFHVAAFASAGAGLAGQISLAIGLCLGLLFPMLFYRLSGRTPPQPYFEPLPPLDRRRSSRARPAWPRSSAQRFRNES
jgi:hypothetical protein